MPLVLCSTPEYNLLCNVFAAMLQARIAHRKKAIILFGRLVLSELRSMWVRDQNEFCIEVSFQEVVPSLELKAHHWRAFNVIYVSKAESFDINVAHSMHNEQQRLATATKTQELHYQVSSSHALAALSSKNSNEQTQIRFAKMFFYWLYRTRWLKETKEQIQTTREF